MAQTVRLKRSATQGAVPSTSDLALGEVAINTYDGKMYIKKDDGTASIIEIGGPDGAYTKYSYTATASQTTFSVSYAVGYVDVWLNGVKLDSSDFTASNGSSIVLASGATSGDLFEAIAWNIANIQQNAYAKYSYTATSSQTTFAATYTPGFVNVYLNGVLLLDSTEYTATNGTSIVLASGATAGDSVVIEGFATYSTSSLIPSQTGNSGYYLTTDGTNPSWDNLKASPTFTGTVTATAFSGDGSALTGVDSLPSQSGNSGKFLTTDGSTASWADVSGVDIQAFTSSGTWTKPAGATHVKVEIWGAGGGGGAGGRWSAIADLSGGGGGGGGSYNSALFSASDLGSTVSVTVGAGGAGGTGRSTNGKGASGANGGHSTFGAFIKGWGGGGSTGGDEGGSSGYGGAGGSTYTSTFDTVTQLASDLLNGGFIGSRRNTNAGASGWGGGSGANWTRSGTGNGGVSTNGGSGGGNGGGYQNSGSILHPAGEGGGNTLSGSYNGGGGAAGSGSGNGGNGDRFEGGGGGGTNMSGSGGDGGNGGLAGGGGGGGGSVNGTSGSGGNGGNGYVVVYSW